MTAGHPVLFGIFAVLCIGLGIAGLIVAIVSKEPTWLGMALSIGACVAAAMWIAIRSLLGKADEKDSGTKIPETSRSI